MVNINNVKLFVVLLVVCSAVVYGEQVGSIRGMIYDKDFDAPLGGASVTIAETGESVAASDEGNYVFPSVEAGKYTLVFSKDGYTRQVKADVVVSQGQMTEVDSWLTGDFTEMEEFVVQDVQIGTGTEEALLELRIESPSLLDSISSELMSQAGASDAAAALNLVSGATVQDGKFAVVRGLPDRYVNSQMNGVRLPTADPDKRAVQLDQFPASIIESIQVSKTFTPDQQGDASGGAVNIILKGIPNQRVFKFSIGSKYKTEASCRSDFLSSLGGGMNYWGGSLDERKTQHENLGMSWTGSVGTFGNDSPLPHKWSLAIGDKFQLTEDVRIGGFASFYYDKDISYFEEGIDDKWWTKGPGLPMVPQHSQGSPAVGDFLTTLFDVTQSKREIKWGSLFAVGLETDEHTLNAMHMYTNTSEDTATLLEDTRGKANLHTYWPNFFGPEYDNYNPNDPMHPGNSQANRNSAPYIRLQTLDYTSRVTQTLQFSGNHKMPIPEWGIEGLLMVLQPEFDWTIAASSSSLVQPDKRLFGSVWWAESYDPGNPFFGIDPSIDPAEYFPYTNAANVNLGNVQRTWKHIREDSDQYFLSWKVPFEQYTGDEGYVKVGMFNDRVFRTYDQESYSNFGDTSRYQADWDQLWSDKFPDQEHPIGRGEIDVDYEGEQLIKAWYYMLDIPLTSSFNVIGGYRYEKTRLSIENKPESNVRWIPPGEDVYFDLGPNEADVDFAQDDALPSIGFAYEPFDWFTFRGSYTRTVARQTFKELTPIQQQEYLGADVFIGNPYLEMSALDNYDLRFDLNLYEGGLISISWFKKDITGPIEYVQRISPFSYTTPVNYPEGKIDGYEVEVRQKLGQFFDFFEGLSVGANATLINSNVILPEDEVEDFADLGYDIKNRDMSNAPEHLFNYYMSYVMDPYTTFSVFYTVRGDTLVSGAGISDTFFIPDVYEKEYGTLNMSLDRKLGETWKLSLKAKNLLDPDIQTVYRSEFIEEDVVKTSYRKGLEFSISLSATF